MVFFDKFDESNFDIDSQELEVQAVTVSELKQEYLELGSLRFWPLGEQAARKDGKIIYRSYKTLSFADSAIDFDFVDLGYSDPTTGSRYQWRVIHEFSEKERYSSCDIAFKNFKIWEISDNEFQMEITYDNNITSLNDAGTPFELEDDPKAVFKWERPKDTSINIGTSCPVDQSEAIEGFTLASPWIVKTSIDTGTINVPQIQTTCERWQALPKPFYLVYDAGKSLGAEVNADLTPDNIYISTTTDLTETFKIPSGSGIETDPYKMEYRYLILEWLDPGRDSLTEATIIFRGNESFRIFLPISKDQDPECPEHLDEIPYLAHTIQGIPTRYKPPNEYDFPDNFWNDTVDTTIEGFLNRINATPGKVN